MGKDLRSLLIKFLAYSGRIKQLETEEIQAKETAYNKELKFIIDRDRDFSVDEADNVKNLYDSWQIAIGENEQLKEKVRDLTDQIAPYFYAIENKNIILSMPHEEPGKRPTTLTWLFSLDGDILSYQTL